MSKAPSNLYEISEEGGQVLGEVAHLLEAEGKENLPLTRRVRRAHERLLTADFREVGPHRMMRTDGYAERFTRPILHA